MISESCPELSRVCGWVMFDDIDHPMAQRRNGPAYPTGAKGAIGPCEAHVGLSKNLTVVLLVMGARLLHGVEE